MSEGDCEDISGDLRVGADLVIYIDHSDSREGFMGQPKEGVRRLVDFIESSSPE